MGIYAIEIMEFRAGTSLPFYFYDIALEVQQPIKIHPFAVHELWAYWNIWIGPEAFYSVNRLLSGNENGKRKFTCFFQKWINWAEKQIELETKLYSSILETSSCFKTLVTDIFFFWFDHTYGLLKKILSLTFKNLQKISGGYWA